MFSVSMRRLKNFGLPHSLQWDFPSEPYDRRSGINTNFALGNASAMDFISVGGDNTSCSPTTTKRCRNAKTGQ